MKEPPLLHRGSSRMNGPSTGPAIPKVFGEKRKQQGCPRTHEGLDSEGSNFRKMNVTFFSGSGCRIWFLP